MPVSHIGLTVSHLPTSCSFYLAALSPLGYRYLGHEGNQIAFGRDNADFYISQETDSIKATAAHIAFNAPSRSAVDAFFLAALKAGGRIHGEPAVRDPETGYYSAAVIDFDDNSIEAMCRESVAESTTDDKKVLDWQKNVAKSTADRGPQAGQSSGSVGSQASRNTARIIVNNVTTPAMVGPWSPTQIKDDGDMSAKALIGTLLGAAAGAAVAYAMTKGEAENKKSPITQTITYQTFDASEPRQARSSVISRRSFPSASSADVVCDPPRRIEYPQASGLGSRHSAFSRHSSRPRFLEEPKAVAGQAQASTLIETFIPPSDFRPYPPHAIARSHTDSIIQHSKAIRDFDLASQHSGHSRASSGAKTATLKNLPAKPGSSTRSNGRLTRDILLPFSGPAGSTAPPPGLPEAPNVGLSSELGSVAPSDSVSQAGSRHSKTSKRSSRHGRSKLGHDDDNSHTSDKTVRYRGSKPGVRKETVVSLPMRPSSKASVHRSVRSFFNGM